MTRLESIGVLVSVLIFAQVSAHELTKAEVGRELVSQCFTQCALKVADLDAEHDGINVALLEQLRDLGGRAARSGIDVNDLDSFHALLENAGHVSCSLTQTAMHVADLCEASCRDLEHVYGPVNSWAKTRFRYHFNEAKADLKESGLWTSYTDYPRADDDEAEFDLACEQYLNN